MHQLVLSVPEHLVEPLSDALAEVLDALSVSVEDADADSPVEQALFGEPGLPPPRGAWARSTVTALFHDGDLAAAAAAWVAAHDDLREAALQSIDEVPDADWVRLTQAQFAPVRITDRFWIVPSWHDAPPEATQVIRLDPGLAFGTGTHPTTRMCLRWLAGHAAQRHAAWSRVLDYGCGSGILAIGAALHGARAIDAVDIDPAAVTATASNASANRVTLKAGLPDLAAGAYPLVLANILASPLKLLAPLLCGHVAGDGDLVLAGILERQAGELTAAYAPWCELAVADQEDGWVLMSARFAA